MRLWSVHPAYLDVKGLTALWREALLAQKVLRGETKGYTRHPQLLRFRRRPRPLEAIAFYLSGVWDEADKRGYNYDSSKIGDFGQVVKIPVTRGQLWFEFYWLCAKLKLRDPLKFSELHNLSNIISHPAFEIIEGPVEEWEKS